MHLDSFIERCMKKKTNRKTKMYVCVYVFVGARADKVVSCKKNSQLVKNERVSLLNFRLGVAVRIICSKSERITNKSTKKE